MQNSKKTDHDKNVSGERLNEEWCTGATAVLLAPIWKGKSLKSIVALIISKRIQSITFSIISSKTVWLYTMLHSFLRSTTDDGNSLW